MVSGQHCPGEVVETPGARLAPVALPMRLGVVAPIADHRIAAAAGAAHALGPAMLAHQREALGVIQQPREVDQFRCRPDRPGSLRAAADQRPPHSSQQKPRATATRSSAPQHPETREEPTTTRSSRPCTRAGPSRAARNLAVLRKIAINLVGRDGSTKASVRARRKKAAWDNDYMLQ